jgi:hypothetical protein
MELFAKAPSKVGFAALREILKVKSLGDFLTRVQAMFKNPQFAQIVQSERFWRTDWNQLLNLSDIARAAMSQT